ncbi:MAG TPA: PilZ domain-containing protein [Acidimicrobiales bacterium]|jgi:hypothetical protein
MREGTLLLAATSERREHVRHDVTLGVTCRRLGTRATDNVETRAIDLSSGGVQLHVDDMTFGTGDVLLTIFRLEGIEVDCKGLVVTSRPAPEGAGRYLHVAFTGMSSDNRDGLIEVLRTATYA